MKIKMFQLDAVSSNLFSGNPAAVCILNEWLSDDLLLSIASENNLSETAFLNLSTDPIGIRWFSPKREVDLCGHATLASARVLIDQSKFKDSEEGVDLTSADVIVSIGRGIGKIENIPIAENLAAKLNAQIGASRPVVDAGWLDHSYQIGSSGQTVSPKLYLSIGISGAIQHLVGMKGSKNIMAINKDPNAPIFEISDYAVVGDIFEILPKLIEQL